ncbi:DUF4400 domain-containing protein [Halomonas sp. KO116]|uniref:DUF4400 domain-containing protein n=1 Tax=Halomonas sp. KO116 TaxID=1504981 RepID=UPI0004E2FD1B|nr:DUF4400 domain-containing protein [Halomonas sp. KO116]AJY53111.1 Integrating conjugative element protein [Halomonas sp. KO116]
MKTPFWLIAWLLVAELFIIMVFIPGHWTERVIQKESTMIESQLGRDTVEWIDRKALQWYNRSMWDTGIYHTLHTLLIPTEQERVASRGMEGIGGKIFPWVEDRLAAMMNVVYQVFARAALLIVWAPYMLILLVPALWDGFMTWKIKRTNFDYASPIWHRYGVRGVFFVLQCLLIAFFAPVALNPIIIPMTMMVMCVMMGLATANLQKRI